MHETKEVTLLKNMKEKAFEKKNTPNLHLKGEW